jgi:hypothetical protein
LRETQTTKKPLKSRFCKSHLAWDLTLRTEALTASVSIMVRHELKTFLLKTNIVSSLS